jgi:hypothetical protein
MTPKTTKNNGRHVNGAQIERRVLRMTEREPRPPDLYRVKVAVQQPAIDSKGVNNRRSRQNRITRRNLLPNCYQEHGKWVRG